MVREEDFEAEAEAEAEEELEACDDEPARSGVSTWSTNILLGTSNRVGMRFSWVSCCAWVR